MDPLHPLPSVDPARAPVKKPHIANVPVMPNPMMKAPAPKAVPTHSGVKAPKTRPCYGMTLPVRSTHRVGVHQGGSV
jgi:hypothetical protein